jgi:molybdopterin molybdotransferase
VPPLPFPDARATVLREVRAQAACPPIEFASLECCAGRVLAEDARADRDYPPFHRSTRDGFALRAADLPGSLRMIGEARAGSAFEGAVGPGECIEIMTGAPVPPGADAVVMVEHCTAESGTMSTERGTEAGANIAEAGCEARAGATILTRGTRLDYSHVAWLATIGRTAVPVYKRPTVAILATGDEIIDVNATPNATQIRNSNSYALAAQVRRAGGEAVILPVARDNLDHTVEMLERGFEADMLLLSGGVSAGKYDFVEPALVEFGARFYFDRVLIQPGQPVVFGEAFGRAVRKFFFGLPGNPASTMITFELFGRAALDLLSGCADAPLPFASASLTRPFRHKPGLTRFLPAVLTTENGCPSITPVSWQGSGDVPSICRANAFLVAEPDKPEYSTGEQIPVLLK